MSVEHPWFVGFIAALWFVPPALVALFASRSTDWGGRARVYLALWLLLAPLSTVSIAIAVFVGGMLELTLLLFLAQVANVFISPRVRKLPFLGEHLPTYRPQSKFPFWKAV